MAPDPPSSFSSSAKSQEHRRRRAGAAMNVENFAHRKGVTKAIQSFRKRKDDKRTETAKALRRYKKTMKQEGYEPGRGASRKREAVVEGETKEKSNQEGESENTNTDQKQQQEQEQRVFQKRTKTNPFQKTLKKAAEKKEQQQQSEEERKTQEKQRQKKLKDRAKRSRQLRERTSKGQPVMKHVIHDILRKLERDKEQEQEESFQGKK